MKNKYLIERSNRFKKIFKTSELISPFLAFVDVKKRDMDLIKKHSIQYLSRILDESSINSEDGLLKVFKENKKKVLNITPTGMILPKRDTSLEYNLLLRSWYNAIKNLRISEYLNDCHTPAHLRVKWSLPIQKDLDRPRHAPEEMHFDSWSGYSSQGLTFLLGVLGDTSRNRIRFFEPNENYDENWLRKDGKPNNKKLEESYKPIDAKPKYGQIAILDTCTLHQTFRENESDIRFSIDNIFRAKFKLPFDEHIEHDRKNELTSIDLLSQLGSDCMYLCHHLLKQKKDTNGGAIDPTAFKFIKRKKEMDTSNA